MSKKPRLTAEDWLAAGFRALAAKGPSALRAEALARALGATKGSFYWHFKDLSDFQSQMLALWRTKVASEIIADVRRAATPKAQLAQLVARAAEPAPEAFGGAAIEPAIRAWGLTDPKVASALSAVDAERLAFIAQLLDANGLKNPALPALVYGAYVGLDALAARGVAPIAPGLQALLGLLDIDPEHS